ncbi:MAG: c-type cytochrome [Pyrinomonadaceae bacterium]
MQRTLKLVALIAILGIAMAVFLSPRIEHSPLTTVEAQVSATPAAFDQTAGLAKLREQIKGKENDLAPTVFKNIQTMKNTTAGRLLSVMEMGFARSLGVNCTHCHVPDKWDSEEKPQKQVARDMSAMVSTINRELLRNIKNLKSETPIVNCTTCHRGEIKPAQNMPTK